MLHLIIHINISLPHHLLSCSSSSRGGIHILCSQTRCKLQTQFRAVTDKLFRSRQNINCKQNSLSISGCGGWAYQTGTPPREAWEIDQQDPSNRNIYWTYRECTRREGHWSGPVQFHCRFLVDIKQAGGVNRWFIRRITIGLVGSAFRSGIRELWWLYHPTWRERISYALQTLCFFSLWRQFQMSHLFSLCREYNWMTCCCCCMSKRFGSITARVALSHLKAGRPRSGPKECGQLARNCCSLRWIIARSSVLAGNT